MHRISERDAAFQGLRRPRLGYGVIGNTTDSGPVILGSSPSIPTIQPLSSRKALSGFFVCGDGGALCVDDGGALCAVEKGSLFADDGFLAYG